MKKKKYIAALLAVMTFILLIPTIAMAAQAAPILLPEDWKIVYGTSSAEKKSDNVVLLKGDAAVNDNSHYGPFINTKGSLLANGTVVDEVHVYIDPSKINLKEKFQISSALNDMSDTYLTEICALFYKDTGGNIFCKLGVAPNFFTEISEAGMYTLRFEYIPDGSDILGNFTLLKDNVQFATTNSFSLPGVTTANAKGRRYVWAVDISVAEGITIYSVAMASYTKVDAAIAKANALNKEQYANFSAVEDALAAVVTGKNAAEQTTVDGYATAIDAAIDALVYKDADYSQVAAAIGKANALDKTAYTNFAAVEAAINAVVYGKNITEQAAVDGYATAINAAIDALEPVSTVPSSPSPSPSTSIPPTGDANGASIWYIGFLGSLVCLAVVSILKKRKEQA